MFDRVYTHSSNNHFDTHTSLGPLFVRGQNYYETSSNMNKNSISYF